MRTVLAIDGGGIRGLIPALVLAELERRTGRPIAAVFDLVAGTSTGGILALGLTVPDGEGVRWTADDLVGLYEQEGPRIFTRSLWRTVTSLDGLIDERYPDQALEDVLRDRFGDVRVSDAATEVLITAYDIERRQPYLFKRHRARADEARDAPMWLAARATAAAPTYFEPVTVPIRGGEGARRSLIDGGVYANNPAMCGWVEARKLHGDEPVVVISLGTGELTRPIPHEAAVDWGVVQWAVPLLSTVYDGVGDSVDHQLDSTLNRAGAGSAADRRYWRFQTVLTEGSDDPDDASRSNLQRLRRLAEELIRDRSDDLDDVVQLLTDRPSG